MLMLATTIRMATRPIDDTSQSGGRCVTVCMYLAMLLAISLVPFFVYFSLVFALVSYGNSSDELSEHNNALDLATTIAPWSADASIGYAAYLRRYAVTLTLDDRVEIMSRINGLIESAMKARPDWPYYHLAKYDAEVLEGQDDLVLQERFDTIRQLAPNERGLDYSLIATSFYAWNSLRIDQQQWIARTLFYMRGDSRGELLKHVALLRQSTPSLCTQLPWTLVKSACRG